MKTFFDCIPCFIRQALEAARFVTDDEDVHEQAVRAALEIAAAADMRKPPPVTARTLHRMVRTLTGHDDPYQNIKATSNQYALTLYPRLSRTIRDSPAPLETAARLAIAGNIIDFGVSIAVNPEIIDAAVGQALSGPIAGDMEAFLQAAANAESILYLGDNAGEVVFDKLLMEQLPMDKVIFAVRGGPVINDATLADAEETGVTRLVSVINNGSDAPGTLLEECSEGFRKVFEAADLVIAKGQGNYETLSDVSKNIFFLLKAKCPVIARHIGCAVGTAIIGRRSGNR